MTKSTQITINETGLCSVLTMNGDQRQSKVVDIDDLASIFSSFSGSETELFPGTHGIKKIRTENEGTEKYAYVTPEKVIRINYDGRHFDCFVPRLCWFLRVRKTGENVRQFVDSKVFALTRDILSETDTLYHAPFTNVFNDGKICWGQVNPAFKTVNSVGSIESQFFSARFNSDLNNSVMNYEPGNEEDNEEEEYVYTRKEYMLYSQRLFQEKSREDAIEISKKMIQTLDSAGTTFAQAFRTL